MKLDGLALLPLRFARRVRRARRQRPGPADACAAAAGRAVGPRAPPDRPAHSARVGPCPTGCPTTFAAPHLAVAAIPFGAGKARPVGGLIAWRELHAGRRAFFDHEEILVLKTLADYAAVTLEASRLAHETARLHHEAGQAEAHREMEALREVARLKDEFLGQVSHELRTPLTIIHGYSELMVDGLITDAAMVRQSADEIHTSSALMLRLVDDLLDTSRLDSGRIELKPEHVDLGVLAGPRCRRVRPGQPVASRGGAICRRRCRPISADVDRLGQVMNNLLSNAARYSADRHRDPRHRPCRRRLG